MAERRLLGVGPAAFGADAVIPLVPQHPGAHGALRLAVTVDGDRIVTAEPVIGFMHRGAEKLFESRDYRQIVVLTNRHDWLSAFGNELGLVMAVERMLGLAVPDRAVWLRTALAELNRLVHHLAFLAALAAQLGAESAHATATQAREQLLGSLEEASGGRIHYMFNRVGGLKEDVPAGWSQRLQELLPPVGSAVGGELARLVDSRELAALCRGAGRLDRAAAESFGATGPVARASGLDLDLRRDDPYLAYPQLPVEVVLRDDGDSLARYQCLHAELAVSLRLLETCLQRTASLPGPVNVRLPKVVRAPEGRTYAWTENPAGINGYLLVSRGGPTPWRLKLRTASFGNVQTLRAMLPGVSLAQLPVVLGSLFYVAGDLDR